MSITQNKVAYNSVVVSLSNGQPKIAIFLIWKGQEGIQTDESL